MDQNGSFEYPHHGYWTHRKFFKTTWKKFRWILSIFWHFLHHLRIERSEKTCFLNIFYFVIYKKNTSPMILILFREFVWVHIGPKSILQHGHATYQKKKNRQIWKFNILENFSTDSNFTLMPRTEKFIHSPDMTVVIICL